MESTRPAAKKERILESEGYKYNFDRQLYFNRQAKKAFSIEFIEDNPPDELERRIHEEPGQDWAFFFISPPSDAVKRELISVLG